MNDKLALFDLWPSRLEAKSLVVILSFLRTTSCRVRSVWPSNASVMNNVLIFCAFGGTSA